jgi:hypothetical protein
MAELEERESRRVAEARALPEAAGMLGFAESLASSKLGPTKSMDQIKEILNAHRAAGNHVVTDSFRGRRTGSKEPIAAAAPKPKAAFYSVADAKETVFLCKLAGEPKLAESFIAAKTPSVKVREALAQRAADAQTRRDNEAIARKKAIAASWNEVVAKVNTESGS